ncbi:MAG: hypothetical protein V4489_01055 [Chlamydiota bacterium]
MSTVVTSSFQKAPTDFSNAPMKMASTFLSNVLSRFGCEDHLGLKNVLESGGCGIVPLLALSDDVIEFRKKLSKETSLTNMSSLSCIGSEISFDLYELATTISQACEITALQKVCESVSSGIMGIKVLGSIPLAILTADEACSQIFEKKTFLGSTFVKEKAFERKISSILRASEVGFAALSNVALYCEGSGGNVYATSSLGSNVCKFLRVTYDQSVGI